MFKNRISFVQSLNFDLVISIFIKISYSFLLFFFYFFIYIWHLILKIDNKFILFRFSINLYVVIRMPCQVIPFHVKGIEIDSATSSLINMKQYILHYVIPVAMNDP